MREFLGDYIAGVDFPFSQQYEQLMKIYPEAKVILSVREPETWPKSIQNSIGTMHNAMKSFPASIAVWLMGLNVTLEMMKNMGKVEVIIVLNNLYWYNQIAKLHELFTIQKRVSIPTKTPLNLNSDSISEKQRIQLHYG